MPTRPSQPPSLHLAAALLAGGKATRLGGRAKGLIQLPDGRTIIERLLAEVRAAGISEAIICANDPETYRFLGLPTVPDLHPGRGPLAGIEAAMEHYRIGVDGVLLLPTDLPCLRERDIIALLAAYQRALRAASSRENRAMRPPPARGSRADGAREPSQHEVPVVVASLSLPGRDPVVEPLPAVAPPARLCGPLRDAIAAGDLRVRHLWERVGVITVPFSDPTPFTNINTPDDLARLRNRDSGREQAPDSA